MEVIGLIAEYSPFHHGHLYQLNEIKKRYPDSIIILVLNGYFLQRGLISIESKEEKTKLALKYGVDIVIEHPFVFSTNSADIFAESALFMLNVLKIDRLIFGTESDNLIEIEKAAKKQNTKKFKEELKKYLDQGINYPSAVAKASKTKTSMPNDLLAISYIKAILNNKHNIIYENIKRTNDYHDIKSNNKIISASNIREKIKNGEDIQKYIPEGNILDINYDLFFKLLKYKIISEPNLNKYLSVDEGLDNKLKKVIDESKSLDDLISKVKTKRYTYNKLMRMFIHILVGLTKEDKNKLENPDYIRLLGFSKNGSKYLNEIKKTIDIPVITKLTNVKSIIKEYEYTSAKVYNMLVNRDILEFEKKNKPIN